MEKADNQYVDRDIINVRSLPEFKCYEEKQGDLGIE